MQIENQTPSFLYRAFTEEKYATEFIEQGKIRLGLMSYYTGLEDGARKDIREGKSCSYLKSIIPKVTVSKKNMEITKVDHQEDYLHLTGTHINPLYLLCTAYPDVDLNHLRTKFGSYITKNNDPNLLLADLNDFRPVNTSVEIGGKCILNKISYTKDTVIDIDPDSVDAAYLSFIQKPDSYRNDCEYRFIVTARPPLKGEPEPFIFYDFKKRLDYVELV